MPMREGYAQEVYLVTSGELMSLYAANNICKAIQRLSARPKSKCRLAGVICNAKNMPREEELVAEVCTEGQQPPRPVHSPRPDRPAGGTRPEDRDRVRPGKRTGTAVPRSCFPGHGKHPAYDTRTLLRSMTSNPLPASTCRISGCTLTGALSVVTQVTDAVTVVHGPGGCTHHNFSLLYATALDNGRPALPPLVSTGLLETDVVFGGEAALDRTLDKVMAGKPGAVFVLSTCIVETIGDDIEKVCGSKQGCPVIVVPTAGFLGGSFQAGVNNALISIASMAGESAPNGKVNLIGEKNLEYEVEENYAEVKRLLIPARPFGEPAVRAQYRHAGYRVARGRTAQRAPRSFPRARGRISSVRGLARPMSPGFPSGSRGIPRSLLRLHRPAGIDGTESVRARTCPGRKTPRKVPGHGRVGGLFLPHPPGSRGEDCGTGSCPEGRAPVLR